MTNKPNYEIQRCCLRDDCSKLNHDFKLVSSSLQVAHEKIEKLELAIELQAIDTNTYLQKIAMLEKALNEIAMTNADNPYWAKVVAQAALNQLGMTE